MPTDATSDHDSTRRLAGAFRLSADCAPESDL